MCSHAQATPSVTQTLDELDFERGLWSAANDNDLQRCRHLIQKGNDPSQTDSSGYTPLHYAVRSSSIELVEYLLESGADVNAQDSIGQSPMHLAVLGIA